MNILIVTHLASHSPSGVVTYYQTLARDLRAQGHTVRVLETTATPALWNKLLNYLGHLLNRLGRTSQVLWHETSYFVRLYLAARQVRQDGFDLIHAQDARSGVAAWYALGQRVPVLLTAHFNDDPVTEWAMGGPRTPGTLSPGLLTLLTRWHRWLFAHIGHYIFVSNYAYKQSKHLLPAHVQRLILPNTVSIDPNTLPPRTTQPGAPFSISNVGYVDERKNQELLILIGAELRRLGIADFQINLIGDGPKRADYERLVTNLNLGEHVQFLGRQAEPWRLVRQSDLYVHTALNDNCPYALLEAFAVGTPALALPVGGVPELMPEGTGLLRGRDPVQLAQQLMTYRHAPARQKLAQTQTRYARQHFNPETSRRKLLAFYQKCTGKMIAPAAQPAELTSIS